MSKEQCEKTAVKLLAGRSYSEQELRHRLIINGYGQDAVEQVITDFCHRGYLNDFSLGKALYDKYLADGKYGIHTIVAKLKKRELSDSVIARIIKENDSEQGFQTAKKLAASRFSSKASTDLNSIGRFLAGRGFPDEIIEKVLEQLDR